MTKLSYPDSLRRRQVHEMVLLQKYADIITDTVFKKLFGDERFPDLMSRGSDKWDYSFRNRSKKALRKASRKG